MTDTVDEVHPDLRLAARVLPRNAVMSATVPVLQKITGLAAMRTPAGVEVHDLGDGVTVRLHRPPVPSTSGHAMLWIHGGGYVIGSAAQDDKLCAGFARRLGITVAAVDYRLAPKHPYPVPLQDCHRALEWLARQPDVSADRLIIGGASAGGGLTAALALRCRDMGDLSPVFQLLVYPMLDDRSSNAGHDDQNHRVWSIRSNRVGWSAYLGDADRDLAVPARRHDLAGLPPAWIGVGTHDLFHDEDLEYARRLRESGVAVTVDTVPGAFHGFDLVLPRAGVSREFFARQCEVLAAVIG
ncbi:alpha/beta hydrolase [Gordonia sp. NB41Y]|uniref:alpha/beta hydrolase n=1 Tax=Gordonia sp. NB41Y TaxID=875808 RepID=UPI0002BF045C|nr:alpha/beta hydrolase [Gordonia sp. NB41Y]EMP12174.1 alpha/beta hydrolase [Gordonia sp. NB41Y]WLP90685.1 alpha/beta hydrolase [Gordonia sp. NB41Y]